MNCGTVVVSMAQDQELELFLNLSAKPDPYMPCQAPNCLFGSHYPLFHNPCGEGEANPVLLIMVEEI